MILAAVNGGIPALKSRFINAKYQVRFNGGIPYTAHLAQIPLIVRVRIAPQV